MNWEHDFLLYIQNSLRCAPLDGLMKGLSFLAENGWFFILLGIVLMIRPKSRKFGISVLLGLIIHLIVVNLGLKPLFGRIRPYEMYPDLVCIVKQAKDYSFPSGHTASAFAAATAVLLEANRWRKGVWNPYTGTRQVDFITPGMLRFVRISVIALFVLAALIGFSRIYIGIHYPTDVLGGALVGAFCGYLGVWVRETRVYGR